MMILDIGGRLNRMLAYSYCWLPFDLEEKHYFCQRKHFFKPIGLWACKSNEWLEWCLAEKFRLDKLKYKAILDIDMSNVLIIDNVHDLEHFQSEYAYSQSDAKILIAPDWSKCAKEYAGIWVDNYYFLKSNKLHEPEYDWLNTWDVPSGCIWDMSAIKSIDFKKVSDKELGYCG